MKFLGLFCFITSVQAATVINCTNPTDGSKSYVFRELSWDKYSLSITQRKLVPLSCQTRWGCDYEEKEIYKDKLKLQDFQGAWVFESRRTYVNMEFPEETHITYAGLSEKLDCHIDF